MASQSIDAYLNVLYTRDENVQLSRSCKR